MAEGWIAKRRELLAQFLKPYRGKAHDNIGLSILAMTDFPFAMDALDYVLQLHQSGDEVNGGSDEDAGRYSCTGCCYDHPCPTRQAIEEKLVKRTGGPGRA